MRIFRSATVLSQDGGQFLDSEIEIVVDHLIIVTFGKFELASGIGQSALDGCLVVGRPRAQPSLEDVQARHLNKNQQRAGDFFPNLEGSLNVDDQKDANPLFQRSPDGFGGCAIGRSVDFGGFQQVVSLGFEFLGGEKKVVNTGSFARARGPCRR
jgi:hypothetical protein